MKVNSVGDSEELLLWPGGTVGFVQSSSSDVFLSTKQTPAAGIGVFDSVSSRNSDLLWPAELINQQARLCKQRDYTLPLAILTFGLSFVLGLAVGPLQLIMIATTHNYNWVTTIFYNSVLRFVLPIAGILAIIDLVILGMVLLKPTLKQRTVITLVLGSLVEIGAIWVFGYYNILPPPQLILVLVVVSVLFVMATLFINKQYVAKPELGLLMKAFIAMVGVVAVVELILSGIYIFQPTNTQDDSEIAHLTVLQAEARTEGVSERLSDLVFAVCNNSRYQVVYTGEHSDAGIFECTESGEVYSVMEYDLELKDTITGGATYLGTTKDKIIAVAFPNTYYLYRSLPNYLSEDELAIMFPATSEQELVDNLAPMLFNFWQEHNEHNLYLNVFYNSDLGQIDGTRDFVLMSALGTMVMVEGLPRGLTMQSVANGESADYLFHADTELLALNELGSLPEHYAYSTREALTTHRHISLHLVANEPIEYDDLVQRLWDSFTGGIE